MLTRWMALSSTEGRLKDGDEEAEDDVSTDGESSSSDEDASDLEMDDC